jgi:hypothetical protein
MIVTRSKPRIVTKLEGSGRTSKATAALKKKYGMLAGHKRPAPTPCPHTGRGCRSWASEPCTGSWLGTHGQAWFNLQL